jgi:hypothetical protein
MADRPAERIVTAIYSEWNRGEWAVEHFHPDVEWEMSSGAFDEIGRSRGRDALMRYWRRFWAAWQPGATSGGRPLEWARDGLAVFHLWTVEGERVSRLLVFDDRQSALNAAAG